MTIILAGGELDVLNPVSGGTLEVTTPAGSFNSSRSRCSIRMGTASGAGTGFVTPNFTGVNELWVHWVDYYAVINASLNAGIFIAFRNSVGQDLFRINKPSGFAPLQASFWNGSTFVNNGTTFALTFPLLYEFDLRINFATGIWELYSSKTLVASGSGMAIAGGLPQNIYMENVAQATNYRYCSQFILADEDTRNMSLTTIPANGNGANTAWTGVFTDINEIALNDATFIESVTAGQLETFTVATPSLGSVNIKAVVLGCRASRAAVGPQNIEGITRVAGTDYFTPQFSPGLALGGRSIIIANNPATGLAWQASDITAANFQYGAASRA